MSKFLKAFLAWFTVLLVFFVLANLAGLVRPKGLLPFRTIGFPVPMKAWGVGIDESFEWVALIENATLALSVSGVLGWICARTKSKPSDNAAMDHA
jgi:hypothetical protein